MIRQLGEYVYPNHPNAVAGSLPALPMAYDFEMMRWNGTALEGEGSIDLRNNNTIFGDQTTDNGMAQTIAFGNQIRTDDLSSTLVGHNIISSGNDNIVIGNDVVLPAGTNAVAIIGHGLTPLEDFVYSEPLEDVYMQNQLGTFAAIDFHDFTPRAGANVFAFNGYVSINSGLSGFDQAVMIRITGGVFYRTGGTWTIVPPTITEIYRGADVPALPEGQVTFTNVANALRINVYTLQTGVHGNNNSMSVYLHMLGNVA